MFAVVDVSSNPIRTMTFTERYISLNSVADGFTVVLLLAFRNSYRSVCEFCVHCLLGFLLSGRILLTWKAEHNTSCATVL